MKKTPKLRFKEFSGDWEEKKLGEVGEFFKGSTLSKANLSEYGKPCILYGELYTRYGEVISKVISKTDLDDSKLVIGKKNDVLIPSSGESAIDIATASCLQQDNVLLGGDLNVFRSDELNGIFASYQLNNSKRHEIAKLAQGASVVHVYNNQLSNLKLNIPSKEEQEKIANFLSLIDNKISLQSEKVEALKDYKKGMMQKIFARELRFKDDEGRDYPEWEEKKLGDLANIQRGASPRPIADPRWFDENSNIGWVRISDVTSSNIYLNKVTQYLSNEGVKKSRLLEEPHLILSIAASVGKPIINKIPVCIHDGFIVFKNLELDILFGYYFLNMYQDKWENYKQPGTQFNLNSDLVAGMDINVPCNDEQKKISSFLNKIDNKIEKEQEKLNSLNEYKKGLLQQMFI